MRNDRKAKRDAMKAFRLAGLILSIAVTMFFVFVAKTEAKDNFCSQTAEALFTACKAGVTEDSFVKQGICINYSDETERDECFSELEEERTEGRQECADQREWRLDGCELIGQQRYDPNFDPANFDDDFTNLTKPNPYFPLTIGNQWKYRGGDELNVIQILNQTKLIDGVTCVVVRDKVFSGGSLVENTDDWFAQNLDKNVWYCGEEVKDFEVFPGDKPMRPELVSIDGSFKAGRNRDKPGIIFLASPKKDDVYTEEFSLANAEDVTVVLSTNYSFGKNPELDQFVPQQLVDKFCSGNCIVTKNFSLLEPDIFARKYYARGIGLILEVEPDQQLAIQLVECNFDSRCEGLPIP